MSDPKREAPPGLYTPTNEPAKPFDHRAAVLWALIVAVVGGVGSGFLLDDWEIGGAICGGLYVGGLLTIIAWKN
ncbi:MAG: hypothetical protein KDA90_22000 [Planctomycetaceae bacterium]|nr:hypothetical protein [Planctomycetaceae bacterium]